MIARNNFVATSPVMQHEVQMWFTMIGIREINQPPEAHCLGGNITNGNLQKLKVETIVSGDVDHAELQQALSENIVSRCKD